MKPCGCATGKSLAHSVHLKKAFSIFAGTAAYALCSASLMQLGRLLRRAVNALLAQQRLQPRDIVAIGCHGQTVSMNRPARPTYAASGDNIIVAHTRDYSGRRFSAAGYCAGRTRRAVGRLLHHALLGHPTEKRMVLNIGGIANLSAFPRTGGARVRHGAG